MDPLVIGSLITLVGTLIGSGINYFNQKKQRQQQDTLTKLQMQREDNSMQRQVADLKAAGLSPLMASGGSPTGQLMASPSPTFDISNATGVMSDMLNRKQNSRQFTAQYNLQKAQLKADLITKEKQNQLLDKQVEAQDIANEYNRKHGLRDPGWQNYAIDVLDKYLENNNIDLSAPVETNIQRAKKFVQDKVSEVIPDVVEKPVKQYIATAKATLNNPKQGLKNDIATVKKYSNMAKDYVLDKYEKGKNYVSNKTSSAKSYVYQKYNKAKSYVKSKISK